MPNCEVCGQAIADEWVLVPLSNADLDVLFYHPECHSPSLHGPYPEPDADGRVTFQIACRDGADNAN